MAYGPTMIKMKENALNTMVIASTEVIYTRAFSLVRGVYFGLMYKGGSSPDLLIQLEESYTTPSTEESSDTNFVVPDDFSNIETNLITTTWHIKTLSPIPALYGRFKITGNAGNGSAATLIMNVFKQED